MIIPVTEEMRDEASRRQEAINAKWPPKESYTGLAVENANLTGHLGQLAFRELLDLNFKRYVWGDREPGMPDNYDFVVYSKEGRPAKLDVKTAADGRSKPGLMMPEVQYQKKRLVFEVYVSARMIDGTEAVLFEGWTNKEQLAAVGTIELLVTTRWFPLEELWSMESLMGRMQDA